MTGFEHPTSGMGSHHSANCATTTAPVFFFLVYLFVFLLLANYIYQYFSLFSLFCIYVLIYQCLPNSLSLSLSLSFFFFFFTWYVDPSGEENGDLARRPMIRCAIKTWRVRQWVALSFVCFFKKLFFKNWIDTTAFTTVPKDELIHFSANDKHAYDRQAAVVWPDVGIKSNPIL